ncbi:hypothetical protein [Amphibiibacter pelophylacis]|uniref:Uncharacterized protein n=1 Tax=Amphibiibacter pelophylacis TaxID=1799477 RepID=A0ACC6P1W4_9BURK
MLLPFDDLLVVVRELVDAPMLRRRLIHCLRWNIASNLKEIHAKSLADFSEISVTLKVFKDYAQGLLYLEIKYLPLMLGAICSLPSIGPRAGCFQRLMTNRGRASA